VLCKTRGGGTGDDESPGVTGLDGSGLLPLRDRASGVVDGSKANSSFGGSSGVSCPSAAAPGGGIGRAFCGGGYVVLRSWCGDEWALLDANPRPNERLERGAGVGEPAGAEDDSTTTESPDELDGVSAAARDGGLFAGTGTGNDSTTS